MCTCFCCGASLSINPHPPCSAYHAALPRLICSCDLLDDKGDDVTRKLGTCIVGSLFNRRGEVTISSSLLEESQGSERD